MAAGQWALVLSLAVLALATWADQHKTCFIARCCNWLPRSGLLHGSVPCSSQSTLPPLFCVQSTMQHAHPSPGVLLTFPQPSLPLVRPPYLRQFKAPCRVCPLQCRGPLSPQTDRSSVTRLPWVSVLSLPCWRHNVKVALHSAMQLCRFTEFAIQRGQGQGSVPGRQASSRSNRRTAGEPKGRGAGPKWLQADAGRRASRQ